MKKLFALIIFIFLLISCSTEPETRKPINISGIYPHLAYYNNEGECGTGAVVSWADRLWIVTYGPHLPNGSSDKLYEITPDLQQIIREESIGGTPANRMIHKESNQLFIGPYAINDERHVRTIPYSEMPGRLTGNARHLTDPEHKIYYGTMEEGFYGVDVHSLLVNTLYVDGNQTQKEGEMAQEAHLLPGAHGKGLYSGQGVLVYSNNGEATPGALEHFDLMSGVLAEWDGENWKIVRRNQFVEVTGPGGIYGNENPDTDPIWATGWDHKSVILGVRSPEGWNFYRLPKASHSYDGAHGWNTEWPRIRDIGTENQPDYLMTMHGMFWQFPGSFTARNSAGIRPRSAYLKVIGDYTRWNDKLVFGCDDSAQKEFLNKRKAKGNIEGPGQSNSNLWFTSIDKPDNLGPNTAEGAVWLSEKIKAGEYSEPMLFAGWPKRIAWIKNEGKQSTSFLFEIDKQGNNQWMQLKEVVVQPGESAEVDFLENEIGEWIRVKTNKETKATVNFSYSDIDNRLTVPNQKFCGIASVNETEVNGGLLYGLGNNRKVLGILVEDFSESSVVKKGYYELDSAMNLVKKDNPEMATFIEEKFAVPENVITIDKSSVLIVDDLGRRWRLPMGDDNYSDLTNSTFLRICREVATERDLLNCHGTFYELPAENADGYAKIRPVASHNFRIHDYVSYRGMLIMTGVEKNATADGEHIFVSEDGNAKIWAGVIDDLWELGKPTGHGGPWKDAQIKAGETSDPYLIGFYDKKSLTISHNSNETVNFRIEVEPIGHGSWMVYKEVAVKPNEEFKYIFPDAFQSRWIRFTSDKDCKATTWLIYE